MTMGAWSRGSEAGFRVLETGEWHGDAEGHWEDLSDLDSEASDHEENSDQKAVPFVEGLSRVLSTPTDAETARLSRAGPFCLELFGGAESERSVAWRDAGCPTCVPLDHKRSAFLDLGHPGLQRKVLRLTSSGHLWLMWIGAVQSLNLEMGKGSDIPRTVPMPWGEGGTKAERDANVLWAFLRRCIVGCIAAGIYVVLEVEKRAWVLETPEAREWLRRRILRVAVARTGRGRRTVLTNAEWLCDAGGTEEDSWESFAAMATMKVAEIRGSPAWAEVVGSPGVRRMPPAGASWTNPGRWGTLFKGTWEKGLDSNHGELVTASLLYRHLSRTRASWDTKSLAFGDNLAALAVLQKGRSSVPRMLAVARKVAAVSIILGVSLVWGYIQSEVNPADAPSRGLEAPGVHPDTAAKGFGSLLGGW
jgi:hypothetical protein